MSNFVIAVGGSGAKLMQSLVHLGAAGLMPPTRNELLGQLVDPDENNGNVEECKSLVGTYKACKRMLELGNTDLFSAAINVDGPWTPLREGSVDTLKEIFQYDRLQRANSVEADLLDLFFENEELSMSIRQGFRGRPAIGATVLTEAVKFTDKPWSDIREQINRRGNLGSVRVLLAGSVFGGSGASGVPTLVRLLKEELADQMSHLDLGLILFLPFFQFRPVPGEAIQADPALFPMATAEALKYYYDGFLRSYCHSIFCVGEEIPSDVAVSAVGASEQKNEPHFVELIAGMAATRFYNDQLPLQGERLLVAGRKADGTLDWEDLPYDRVAGKEMAKKIQTMVLFAVAYRYYFFPFITDALAKRKSDIPFWVDNIKTTNLEEAGRALRQLDDYVEYFLRWIMHVCTPRREGFTSGLVNPHIFAVKRDTTWDLKSLREFNLGDFNKLFLNLPAGTKIDSKGLLQRSAKPVTDPKANGVGRVVRALYDACILS